MRGSTLMWPPRVGSSGGDRPQKQSGPGVSRGPLDRSVRTQRTRVAGPPGRVTATDRTRQLASLGWERVLRLGHDHRLARKAGTLNTLLVDRTSVAGRQG